ncbi:hypothetical protein MNBD_NITROSPINAE01-1194, partial [hydrothermal vent metagenome]
MKKTTSSSTSAKPMNNRRGATLVLAMLVLAMVTIMGVYSATRSSLEQNISKNLETDMSLFFAAEAGLNHAVKILSNDFANPAVNSAGSNWNFALDGSRYGQVATARVVQNGQWTAGNGVPITSQTFSVGAITVNYTVELWNNNDGGNGGGGDGGNGSGGGGGNSSGGGDGGDSGDSGDDGSGDS